MRIVTETLRWLFIAISSLVFLAGLYLMSIELRPNQNSPQTVLGWVWAVIGGILVMGLLPLIVAVVWALRVHTLKFFVQGVLVLLGMLAFHYCLFAFAAHSDYFRVGVTAPNDRIYPLLQAIEFALFGLAMWFLLKVPRNIA